MLKRKPSLTEQAKAAIKQRLLNDEFAEGRIPSETDLAEQLGVSRTTIRDALSRLELEGAIYRKQGAGTFVNRAGLQIKSRLEEIWNYEDMLRAHGYTPSTRIVSFDMLTTNPEAAVALNRPPDDFLLVVKKLFLANDQPVILTVNHISLDLVTPIGGPDNTSPLNYIQVISEEAFHLPVYDFLAQFCRQHLSYYISEIVPLIAPAWVADTLNLPKRKTALLAFDEVGYNQNNQPIVKAYSYFRDDMLRLKLIRRETQ
jgi:GntR family transcriptional regulator